MISNKLKLIEGKFFRKYFKKNNMITIGVKNFKKKEIKKVFASNEKLYPLLYLFPRDKKLEGLSCPLYKPEFSLKNQRKIYHFFD